LKIDAPAKSAPAPAPAEPTSEPADDAGFGDFGGDEDMTGFGGDEKPANNDKPFDDEPFDAGVEADEETDPKKFIEQLTGKLGQSLRKYTEEQGQPDFELEKFAINSLLSATHTAEMDNEDKKDIIKKVNSAGDDGIDNNNDSGDSDESGDELGGDMGDLENSDDEGLQEGAFILDKDQIKRSSLFAPKGSKEAEFKHEEETLEEGLWDNIRKKRARGESPAKPGDEDYPDKKQWNKLTKEGEGQSNNYMFWQNLKGIYDDATEMLNMNEQEVDSMIADGHQWAVEHVITSKDDIEEVYHFLESALEGNDIHGGDINEGEHESNNYMFWSSLKTIQHASKEILEMDNNKVDSMIADGHAWAVDHIATSADDMEEAYHFLANTLDAYDGDSEGGYKDDYGNVENVNLNEAEYQGKTVKLGKPTKGDVKKFKVYVKNKKGNVVKVNFGDPNMEIKRDNPKNKKSFRARHKCAQAKDRTTPKYWSCKMWSKTPVSKIVGENLISNEKNSKFDKNYLRMKIQETFNQDSEPMVQPQIKPDVKPAPDKVQPNIAPSRKNKPFLPMPEVTPDPKAIK
jgi:hypothetical protein